MSLIPPLEELDQGLRYSTPKVSWLCESECEIGIGYILGCDMCDWDLFEEF